MCEFLCSLLFVVVQLLVSVNTSQTFHFMSNLSSSVDGVSAKCDKLGKIEWCYIMRVKTLQAHCRRWVLSIFLPKQAVVHICNQIRLAKNLHGACRQWIMLQKSQHFLVFQAQCIPKLNMSYFAYACKTEGKNGISRLISALCVNCPNSIPEYSRIIDYSIILMCIWCGLLQKLYKIKKSELLNSKVYSKV